MICTYFRWPSPEWQPCYLRLDTIIWEIRQGVLRLKSISLLKKIDFQNDDVDLAGAYDYIDRGIHRSIKYGPIRVYFLTENYESQIII